MDLSQILELDWNRNWSKQSIGKKALASEVGSAF